MRFTVATIVAILPLLVVAIPYSFPKPLKNALRIPLSKRSKLVDKNGVVNITALNTHVVNSVAKIDRGYANYERNTGFPHPNLKGLQKRDTGSVQLTPVNDGELWQGTIAVGTPPVMRTVEFDTGSADMFLPGPTCGLSCAGHAIYDPRLSSTSNDLGTSFTVTFTDGSAVTGEQWTDTVQIADMTATAQTLGVASQYPKGFSFAHFPADGVVGMAFDEISDHHARPLFQTLASEGVLDWQIFAFKLAPAGSELYIGALDNQLYIGDFSYAPVIKEGYWQVSISTVKVNGGLVLAGIDAIIDTGCTLIIGGEDSVAQLYDAIGGTASPILGPGIYTFPCDKIPIVSLTFGGTPIPIYRSAFNRGPVSPGSNECIGGIVAASGLLPAWIIGDVFLTNVYTVFDYANRRVGFATLSDW